MLQEGLTHLADLRSNFGQPDCGLDSFDLAEERPDAVELVMSPVLEQPGGLRGDAPVVGVLELSPSIDLFADGINDRDLVVLLFLGGEPFAFVEDEGLLIRTPFAFLGLGNRRDELRAPTGLGDPLGGLPRLVEFPMASWVS